MGQRKRGSTFSSFCNQGQGRGVWKHLQGERRDPGNNVQSKPLNGLTVCFVQQKSNLEAYQTTNQQ